MRRAISSRDGSASHHPAATAAYKHGTRKRSSDPARHFRPRALTKDFLSSSNNVISSSKISSSVIAGNQAEGVLISENSDNNTVRSSQVLNNSLNGVDVYPGVTGTRVLSNTVNGNGSGIVLRSGATGNTVKSNTAKNNTDFDMEDDNGPTCDTNVWLHNNFNTANDTCIP